MKTKITILNGDGIGPEIMKANLRVLETLCPDVFEYEFVEAGEKALETEGVLLPEKTVRSLKQNRLAIKSPLNTPKGNGFKSLNVTLRQMFNLYANVRPIVSFKDTNSKYENVNLIVVRENTEGMYCGEGQVSDGEKAEAKSIVTKKASENIVKFAYEYAKKQNMKKVSIVHKANILKTTSGLFLKTGLEVSQKYPEIQTEEMIVDACSMNLVKNPNRFQVIVTTNLFGDILSDLCAGLVGGLGLAPGANIGDDMAIFEAVHGTAPDIAGKNLANPSSLMLSTCMMLESVTMKNGKNYNDKAQLWKEAIQAAISNKDVCTKDLGGNGGTTEFTDYIVEYIKNKS